MSLSNFIGIVYLQELNTLQRGQEFRQTEEHWSLWAALHMEPTDISQELHILAWSSSHRTVASAALQTSQSSVSAFPLSTAPPRGTPFLFMMIASPPGGLLRFSLPVLGVVFANASVSVSVVAAGYIFLAVQAKSI